MNDWTVPRQGRVLMPTPTGVARTIAAPPYNRVRFFTLMGAMLFFGQPFHYMVDVGPFYLLSKAWPIICLPLTLYAVIWLRLPHRTLYIVMLAYLLGITPALSMIHLGNDLFDAMVTTIKALPFTYYFALSTFLFLLNPSVEDVKRTMAWLGIATFVIMVLLWFVVPNSWYEVNLEDTKLFINDEQRGNRIYMPMFFGVFYLFYLTRRFGQTRKLGLALLVAIGVACLFLIYKQRVAIAATLIVIGYGFAMSLPRRVQVALITVSLCILAVAGGAVLLPAIDNVVGTLGGSLSVRQNTISLTLTYLSDDVTRWLLGVGSITRLSTVTLADVFGDQMFYLADIGWLGVIFEYGIVGALLILAVYVVAWTRVVRGRDTRDPFLLALSDYVIYLLLSSLVYSAVFTPGEVASVMAIVVYVQMKQAKAGPAPVRRFARSR